MAATLESNGRAATGLPNELTDVKSILSFRGESMGVVADEPRGLAQRICGVAELT